MAAINLNQYLYLTPTGDTPGGNTDFIMNLSHVIRIDQHASGESILTIPKSGGAGTETIQVTLLFADISDSLERLNRFPATAIQPQIGP